MIMATDFARFGGGFLIGLITGYAIKKVIKLAAVMSVYLLLL
jgi:uncharacterized membrane protein (Fun14 family)